MRGRGFSELKSYWNVPLLEDNYVGAICCGPGMYVHTVYVRMYICEFVAMQATMSMHISANKCAHKYACMHMHMYVHVHVHVYTYVDAYRVLIEV